MRLVLKNNLIPIKNVIFDSAKCIAVKLRMHIFHSFIGTGGLLMVVVVVMLTTMVTTMVTGVRNIVYADKRFANNTLRVNLSPHHRLIEFQFPRDLDFLLVFKVLGVLIY